MDEGRKLYAIKNWSDEYDISEGIPSGEMVNNAYEADSFFSNATVETVFSDTEIEAEVQWAWEFDWYDGGIVLIDEEGNEIPTQIITELSVVPKFRSRFVFKANIPALGYKSYIVKQVKCLKIMDIILFLVFLIGILNLRI